MKYYHPAWHLPREDRYRAHLIDFILGTDPSPEAVFARIYRLGLWWEGESSGAGSLGHERDAYLQLVNPLLRARAWDSVVDLGCGDGAITVALAGRDKTGVDVYRPHLERLAAAHGHITWVAADLDRDRAELPGAEVATLKDVLHHWPTALVRDWLTWARQCGKWGWLLLTYDVEHARADTDCRLGGYRPLSAALPPLSAALPPLAGRGLRVVARYLHKEVALLECAAPDNGTGPAAGVP